MMEEQEPNHVDVKINLNYDYGDVWLVQKRKWWQFWKKKEIFIKLNSEPSKLNIVWVPERPITNEEREAKFFKAYIAWMAKHD